MGIQRVDYEIKKLENKNHNAKLITPWVIRLHKNFNFTDWVVKETQSENFDLCIVHDSFGLGALWAVKAEKKCKTIYDCVEYPNYAERAGEVIKQSYLAYPHFTNLLQLSERKIIDELDGIMTGTPAVAEWFNSQKNLPNAVSVRNCREYQELIPTLELKKDCGLSNDSLVILYPNTVFKGCGLEPCVEALSYTNFPIHIAIMGTMMPQIKEDLINLAIKHRVNSRMHFLPLKSPQELIQYRSGADCALVPLDPSFPNHYTGLPNRVFESIMSRLPIISSDLPLIKALTHEYKNGVWYGSNNPKEIAKIFDEAVTPNKLAELKKHAETAARELCWENEQKTFETYVRKVMGDEPFRKVLLIANKSVGTNNRYYRHTKKLLELGFEVLSLTLEMPYPELQLPKVTYKGFQNPVERKGPAARPPSRRLATTT
ncbi:glycosyltransferase [Legionella oakridgensis]|uniref:glycosyltransferase n=1 Tax=Legionella oakridgensis TaxID=29423 RepID=UPI0004B4B321|nr:glycosyltransferase [Legionella oakridgensis]